MLHKVIKGNKRLLSTSTLNNEAPQKVKTAIVMMNMGGPSTPDETGPFLKRLFADVDIIDLGGGILQKLIGTFVSTTRTPKVAKQYEQIGGSPIRKWTKEQGIEMCKILDEKRPDSAPHKAYTCFRYADPLTDECLDEMVKDGVERAIGFSQFPQWSCTTAGSSYNELWRRLRARNLLTNENPIKWSLIDRWNTHEGYIESVKFRINERLQKFSKKDKAIILFSAHSVPMRVVEKGDHYIAEVAETCEQVMKSLNLPNKHILAWQSKVGFAKWMTPGTSDTIKNLGKKGYKNVLVVPIAFTSDHIETLFEIGIEYKEEAHEAGITNFEYTEGLNGLPLFAEALSDIVQDHLDSKQNHSVKYKTKCLTCTKPECRSIYNPAF